MAVAYLLGSVPTGLLLGRAKGVDVRASGSGNIGATNVSRTLGARLGLLTLLLDLAKGAIPVWAVMAAGMDMASAAMAGLAAMLGHVFPVFAGFRGGKGVATAAGVFVVLSPLAGFVAIAVFLLVYRRSRIVSMASLSAALALPLALWGGGAATPVLWAGVLAASALVATHRDNLRRLFEGTEPPRHG